MARLALGFPGTENEVAHLPPAIDRSFVGHFEGIVRLVLVAKAFLAGLLIGEGGAGEGEGAPEGQTLELAGRASGVTVEATCRQAPDKADVRFDFLSAANSPVQLQLPLKKVIMPGLSATCWARGTAGNWR